MKPYRNSGGTIRLRQLPCEASRRNPSAEAQFDAAWRYDQLVGVPEALHQAWRDSRLGPSDPGNSYLIHKVEGRPGIFGLLRAEMNGPPYLTPDGQIQIMRPYAGSKSGLAGVH
mgnify:CR=1 FL=1